MVQDRISPSRCRTGIDTGGLRTEEVPPVGLTGKLKVSPPPFLGLKKLYAAPKEEKWHEYIYMEI